MKITVTQFNPEAPSEGTLKEGQDFTEYDDELDDQQAILLLERLRASRSRMFINGSNRTAIFDLSTDGTINVEILSLTDDFWAISGVSAVEAPSIIRVIQVGGDFTEFIPETNRQWDAYGPAG
jgi:hypothetical protein